MKRPKTICAECVHGVHSYPTAVFGAWRCKSKITYPERINPVTGEHEDAIYEWCEELNTGDCSQFERRPS